MMQDEFLIRQERAYARAVRRETRRIKLIKVINWISVKITGKPSAFLR